MNIETILTPTELPALARRDLRGTACVVFDILRATSTFVTALHHGADAIIPVCEIAEAVAALAGYYENCPFVRVIETAPRVKDVATSNYAHLSAVTNGTSIAVMSVLDNLNKGAAGGGVQWMNRLLGFDETAGLLAPAPGWT